MVYFKREDGTRLFVLASEKHDSIVITIFPPNVGGKLEFVLNPDEAAEVAADISLNLGKFLMRKPSHSEQSGIPNT